MSKIKEAQTFVIVRKSVAPDSNIHTNIVIHKVQILLRRLLERTGNMIVSANMIVSQNQKEKERN